MPLDLDWAKPLSHRQGAPERLDGIDVYYDFVWEDHFPDGRAQLRHGQALARFVRRTCPTGKTGGVGRAELGDVLEALKGMGDDLDPDAVTTIGLLFGADAKRERRIELLRAITADPGGRYMTGEVLLERVPQRIAETREAINAYQDLLDDPASGETDLQKFIEETSGCSDLSTSKPGRDIRLSEEPPTSSSSGLMDSTTCLS